MDNNNDFSQALRKIMEANRNRPIVGCCGQNVGPTGPTGPSGGPTGPTGATGRLFKSSNRIISNR